MRARSAKAAPQAEFSAPESPTAPNDGEPLVDARIRPLLERYVAAAGAQLTEVGEGLVELEVPAEDQEAFHKRSNLRIAFTLDALERDPDAEIAVVGSPLVEQLITAIRSRGSRLCHGFVPPEFPPSAESAQLQIPITNGSAGVPRIDIARHRVVRLLARVVVSAGSTVEEHLIESGYFDATTGVAVPKDVAEICVSRMEVESEASDVPVEPSKPATELVQLALADLRAGFESKVQKLRAEAQQALGLELHRIDSYYASLLAGRSGRGSDTPDEASRRAYEADHARRRAEEERRHRVRVVVHPVQLSEWELLVQCAKWKITSAKAKRGVKLVAERWLNGNATWSLACPGCGTTDPKSLSVCRSGHLGCDGCSLTCGVCDDAFCREHGVQACHVDGSPICAEHARTCPSCNESHCATHEGVCADGEHLACTNCLAPCALCGRTTCSAHAAMTSETAPRGIRRLCSNCLCMCAGGKSEQVGQDEVTRCSSCDGHVCENHQLTCAVDQRVHCSKHLRRTDGSRRLVCSEHRAECACEPGALLASDEVASCPVCARAACTSHQRACRWCGRSVCVIDLNSAHSKCVTCMRLTSTDEPPENVIAGAAALLKRRSMPRRWKTARDAQHTVVEVDVGWRRRIVFSVRHGDNVVSESRNHSLVGFKALRSRNF